MSEFLTGADLSKKIREIVSGSNVKCAVAYWGQHGFDITDETIENWQVISDVVGGSTSPEALEQLGAPENPNLRHIEHLHAKVFISYEGVVIGSANASANALGRDGDPRLRDLRLREAGVFHSKDSGIWKASGEWFDDIFKSATPVDEEALQTARDRFRYPGVQHQRSLEGLSILEQIAEYPEHFLHEGIGFVFSIYRNEQEEVNIARENARGIIANELAPEIAFEPDHFLLGWSEADKEKMSNRFIEFYVGPRGGIQTTCNQLICMLNNGDDTFNIFSNNTPISLPDGDPFPCGGRNIFCEFERQTLIGIRQHLEQNGGGVFYASEFAKLIRDCMNQKFITLATMRNIQARPVLTHPFGILLSNRGERNASNRPLRTARNLPSAGKRPAL